MPDDSQELNAQIASYFAPDFFETYANQAMYEASAWGLKIIFGLLDQSTGEARVKKTFAVNIPWPLAKLATFSLRVQVAAEEAQDGQIVVRAGLIPPEAPALNEEQEADPVAKRMYEKYAQLREEFLRECSQS
jgi:hypothetical protein